MSGDAAQALIAALRATIAALEGQDAESAAASTAAMTEACLQAARAETVFSPSQLAQARQLYTRCEELATVAQARIVAAVLQSSTERKANHAYGSGK